MVFNLHAHLFFVTKYRNKVFTKKMLERMKTIFSDICERFDSTLSEFDGEHDHVHLMIHYPNEMSALYHRHECRCLTARRINNRSILNGIGELLDPKQKDWVKSHLLDDTKFFIASEVRVITLRTVWRLCQSVLHQRTNRLFI